MTNAKPTQGPWHWEKARTVYHLSHHVVPTAAHGNNQPTRTYAISGSFTISEKMLRSDEAQANAALIAEAGTVYHETGLTPRQLADDARGWENAYKLRGALLANKDKQNNAITKQRDELLAALEWIADVADINYQQDRKLRSDSARTLARIIKKADTAIAAAKGGAA